MGAEDCRRIFAVARTACIKELVVLALGLRADFGCGIVGTDITIHVRMELFDELEQESVARCFIESEMELEVKILKLVCIGFGFAFLKNDGSLFNAFVRHERNRGTNRTHFKDDAGVHCIFKLLTGELCNNGTPVGVNADKTLRIKLAESFPDGNVADAELCGDFVLTKGHSAGKHPADDCGAQYLENPVSC